MERRSNNCSVALVVDLVWFMCLWGRVSTLLLLCCSAWLILLCLSFKYLVKLWIQQFWMCFAVIHIELCLRKLSLAFFSVGEVREKGYSAENEDPHTEQKGNSDYSLDFKIFSSIHYTAVHTVKMCAKVHAVQKCKCFLTVKWSMHGKSPHMWVILQVLV